MQKSTAPSKYEYLANKFNIVRISLFLKVPKFRIVLQVLVEFLGEHAV